MTLPRYTWDQAMILGLATAKGFQAIGLKPATVRKWASRHHIVAVGKAPGGAHLYVIAAVSRHALHAPTDNPAHVSHLEATGRPMPSGGSSFACPG